MDEEDEVTDIRAQVFHNTVREYIVSGSFYYFLGAIQKLYFPP